MRKLATIAIAAAAVVALLAVAPAAIAKSRHRCASSARVDRNRDRIPDRWECRHSLTLRVKQTRRDQDHDHLNNLGEFHAGTNPRDADTDNDGIEDGGEHRLGDDPADDDSDNDGVEDGDENAGTIVSFENGTLTIRRTADNQLVSGQVTDATEIECETAAQHEDDDNVTARASDEGDDDQGGPGSAENENEQGDDDQGDDDQGDDDQGDDDQGDDDERACSKADLTPTTAVHEAELENGVFKEIELVK